MKTKMISFLSVMIVLAAAIGCKTRGTDDALHADTVGMQDRIFVLESLSSGARKIELGKLGINRAQDLDLRLLAQRIFDDHTQAQENLRLVAWRNGIEIPDQFPPDKQLTQLASVAPDQFDVAFVNHMLRTHGTDIVRYESNARNALNRDVRTFAATTLPTLREHLRIAENIKLLVQEQSDDISNEAAGAEKPAVRRDPYYQGDARRRHQFDNRTSTRDENPTFFQTPTSPAIIQ